MTRLRLVALIAALLAALALWQLEAQRAGLEITTRHVGETPVTRMAQPGADGPVVVVAHGFAGSRQMMQAYGQDLARAGYRVWAFDFLGHGRHPVPMSGDVESIDGTTRLLVEQVRSVVDAALAAEGWQGEVALLGHSMATDIIIRTAIDDPRIGPVVAISAFSRAVTPTAPDTLLLITGAWEPGLRGFARDAVAMVNPEAGEGETVRKGDVVRRAVVAPWAEHVAVLHSRAGRAEAVAWLDAAFGRASDVAVRATGPWFLALMAAIVALAAQPLGWAIGYGFSLSVIEGFASDLFRIPFVIYPSTYAFASLVVLLAAGASALIVRRRVNRLDMIRVLKTRE